jgi:TolA-binding protein
MTTMRKSMVILMVVGLFSAISAFAEHKKEVNTEGLQETTMTKQHSNHDEECARECELLLKECGQEVDSIQDRIRKLQTAIKENGANTYTRDELKILNKRLKEANETLQSLTKQGGR